MSEENEDLKEGDIFTSRREKLTVEYARLAYPTAVVESIYECRIWIAMGVWWYLRNHPELRKQAKEEVYNEAILFTMKRWQEWKRAGKPVTGGLVRLSVIKHLKVWGAGNGRSLSHPHPERFSKRKEWERLAKLAEPKLNWKERQMQENLRIVIKDIKEDLPPDQREVLTLKLENSAHRTIEIRLEEIGFRDVRRRVNKALDAIRGYLEKKGYP